jgi:NitT/TauT family transport system permease protein
MSNRAKISEVLVLGRVPEALVTELKGTTGRPAAETTIETLGQDALHAKILFLGAGLSPTDMEVLLPSLRESNPTLVLVAVRVQGESDHSDRVNDLVDVSVQWPEQAEQLLSELQATLKRVHAGGQILSTRNLFLVCCAAALIALWEVAAHYQVVPPYLLPGPDRIMAAFLAQPGAFLGHTLITAAESAAGFLLGNAAAGLTCVLLYRFDLLRSVSLPFLTGLQAIPIVALAPLLTVWLGTGLASKVTMAAIVCFFPVVANLLAAFAAVDRDLAQLFRFHRASYPQTLARLLIPSSFPAILAGLKISGGLAVVGAIVAEFTGADRGLGYLLLISTYRLETDKLFVAIILSGVLGVIFANAANILRLIRMDGSYGSISKFPDPGRVR